MRAPEFIPVIISSLIQLLFSLRFCIGHIAQPAPAVITNENAGVPGAIDSSDDAESESDEQQGKTDIFENGVEHLGQNEDDEVDEEATEVGGVDEPQWQVIDSEYYPMTTTRTGDHVLPLLSELPSFRGPSGSTVPRAFCKTPRHYFELFFTPDVIHTFVTATNSFARNRRYSDWTDVTDDIFKKFLALLLLFGIIKYPSKLMAWSQGMFFNPFVVSTMSRNRFLSILRNWHWTDTSIFTMEERAARNGVNPFWSVQTFVDTLATSYRGYYVPPQCICIDEQCIPMKGRHKCRCYNPSKPFKWHFKVFCLNCSKTGYLVDLIFTEEKTNVGQKTWRPPDILCGVCYIIPDIISKIMSCSWIIGILQFRTL